MLTEAGFAPLTIPIPVSSSSTVMLPPSIGASTLRSEGVQHGAKGAGFRPFPIGTLPNGTTRCAA